MQRTSRMKIRHRVIGNKKGNEMVEASISLPIIILTVMLLIRIFTFYLEILCTGIREHEKAIEEWRAYNGSLMRNYESVEKVEMLKGGLLRFDLSKTVETRAYFYNEDGMVRAKNAL